jgi:putative tryptophan/tyrosine transport system substrate-binding protein
MRRRDLVLGFGAANLTGMGRLHAQARSPRIGIVFWGDRTSSAVVAMEIANGLAALGHREGANLTTEARWAEFSRERAELYARELAAAGCSVIVAQGPASFGAARVAGQVPIVVSFSGDPLDSGFTSSIARPDRGITGISYLSLELVGKRLELLKEVMPQITRIAIIANPAHPGERREFDASKSAAVRLGLELSYHQLREPDQLNDVLAATRAADTAAIDAFPDALITSLAGRFAAFSLANRVPIISAWAPFAQAGNLLSYGPKLRAAYRRVAYFVDRILRGARPDALPFELPREVELVVNMNTARTLGIAIPSSVLVRADEVIE